jgi:hypothetical protein
MHLVFAPISDAQLRANYRAVLPWTNASTFGGQPGGRFVHQVPIPDPIRSRWLQWISDGTPF